MMRASLTRVSRNGKTGPIPVSTSSRESCAADCPLKDNGCYAEQGPLALFWAKVSDGRAGMLWDDFLAAVRKLPKGQLWRHNQAGDLPGIGNHIDSDMLASLVAANRGRNGFTYTHKPLTADNSAAIAAALADGFVINVSADNLAEADELSESGFPVVVVLPSEQMTALKTPAGRHVAICPAVKSDAVTCASCGICAEAGRKAIIGFPAHGTSKRKASAIARA